MVHRCESAMKAIQSVLGVLRAPLIWLLAGLWVLAPLGPLHAQCWDDTPGHGANGIPTHGTASTVWDPDGGGPQSPMLVVASSGVRAWDGSAWTPLGGTPQNGEILALTVYGDELYAGGTFSAIGSDVVRYLARWDGSHWIPLATGLTNGPNSRGVNCLEVFNGVLYAGGLFYRVETGTFATIVGWNGVLWLPQPQTQSPIADLTVFGGQLHAATLPGVPGVYRLDSDWTRIGTLADHGILAIAAYNGSLIAGGEFTHFFTGQDIHGVARWSGTAWVPMGTGIGPAGSQVTSLNVYNGSLIAAGEFSTGSNIAAWNGVSWSTLGTGITLVGEGFYGGLESLTEFNGELIALGWIENAGGTVAKHIARWNGSGWMPFVAGINGRVRTFLPAGTTIYAGGNFDFGWQGAAIDHVLSSDGANISNLSGLGGQQGTSGIVNALTFHTFPIRNTKLVVGGSFSFAGGVAASNVASFILGEWAAVGAGFNNAVTALASYGGALYAAGIFTASGGTPLAHVARFGSGGWSDLGAGAFPPVYALTVSNGQLVIGGVPGSDGVSGWNGSAFTSYGAANGHVFAMTTYNGDLIVGGDFTSLGGQTAFRVARRDAASAQWFGMGSGFDQGGVYALAVNNGVLYAGGTFLASGGMPISYIAAWTGASWAPAHGGLDAPVYALASFNGALQVGGDFNHSLDGVASPFWIEDSACVVGVDPSSRVDGVSLGLCYPSPSRSRTRIPFSLATPGLVRLEICDLAGRIVCTLADGWFGAGPSAVEWDGRDERGRSSPAGIYFYRLRTHQTSLSRQLVLMR